MRCSFVKPKDNAGTTPGGWIIGGYTLGLERTVVQVGGKPYLGRWMVYVAGYSIRLHKFYKGDDMRAPHDHPWPFITIPLCKEYWELVPTEYASCRKYNRVRGWRPHYRPAKYRHIVVDPDRPFWTIVLTGRKTNDWGFYPRPTKFVPWREWSR
jgi:hypothetical protein